MRSGRAFGVVAASLVLATAGVSGAGEPERRGAVVVAVGDASAAARPLAKAVYADPALRPSIDDATARALIGEAVTADAGSGPAVAKEVGETRAALVGVDDAASRRLFASLGTDVRASVVVAVSVREGRAFARVLRLPDATPHGAEIAAAVDDAGAVTWPGAIETIRGLVPKEPTGALRPIASPAPAAPAPPAPAQRSMFSSPWFWGGLGAVAAAAVTAFVVTTATSSDDANMRVQGRVAP